MGGDRGIEFFSIATDFELVDEEELVAELRSDKIIPVDATVTFEEQEIEEGY